ncbi:MAG TPA: type II secretion system F family protein [Lachnospiraceae bacterium]|nr:type II secretion system F family protein [Lachnospiraceae bacterium]
MKTDYCKYKMNAAEILLAIAKGAVLTAGIDWLFYQKLWALAFLSPLFIFCVIREKKKRLEARRKKLHYDFREALSCLSVSLRAGYSVENAFRETEKDLGNILGKNACITREFAYMNSRIRLSVPVEMLLLDLGQRTGIEDIENFAAVFGTAKRMGGNMVDIIQQASSVISGKIDVEREIETALAAKKFEQRIMGVMPCAILLYMQLASPGFLDILYTGIFGFLVMTACLAVYAAALFWGSRIVDIRI